MRRWSGLAAGIAVVAAAGNAVAWRHAVAMTTFRADGPRTPPPEELTVAGKVEALLLGVRIPRPRETRTPGDVGLVFTDHRIAGPAGPLVAWRVPGGPEVAILVHGYAGERGQLLETAVQLNDLGYTVVLPNLRASGDSTGDQTTLGWHEAADVAAVVAWVDDPQPLLYGFSMGGAAVLGAVARHGAPAERLVVESTFDRLITTTGHRFAHMGLPRRGLSDLLLFWGGVSMGVDPYRVAPVLDAPAVRIPTLVVSGTDDARVRPDEARALAAALPHGSLALVEGLPHAPLARFLPERWGPTVARWLTEK